MNLKVIIYWQDDSITCSSIHLEDLEDYLIALVLNRGQPFVKANVLNWNFPKSEIVDEALMD